MLPLVTAIVLGVFTISYLIYGSLTVRHATHFRYLSKRTVYLTIFFIGASALLFTLSYVAFAIMLFN